MDGSGVEDFGIFRGVDEWEKGGQNKTKVKDKRGGGRGWG